MKECERTAPGLDLKGVNVLVADDEEINIELISEILVERGMAVSTAANGAEAVAEFKEHDFELILMDMSMPVKDGYEAAQEIRDLERQQGGNVAIIAMTGFSGDEVQQECADSVLDGYIAKPIVWKVMFNEIARVLSLRRELGGHQKKTKIFKGLEYDKFVSEMCNGNEELAVKLVNRFIGERGPELLRAATELAGKQDVKRLREVCHSLVGVCGSMCATEMAAGASELRELAIGGEWAAMPKLLDELLEAHYRILTWWEGFFVERAGG